MLSLLPVLWIRIILIGIGSGKSRYRSWSDLKSKKIPTFFLQSKIWYSKLFLLTKWFIFKNNIIFLYFLSFFLLPGSIPDPFSHFTIRIRIQPYDSDQTGSGSATLSSFLVYDTIPELGLVHPFTNIETPKTKENFL